MQIDLLYADEPAGSDLKELKAVTIGLYSVVVLDAGRELGPVRG
jgi:hypothetical protein